MVGVNVGVIVGVALLNNPLPDIHELTKTQTNNEQMIIILFFILFSSNLFIMVRKTEHNLVFPTTHF